MLNIDDFNINVSNIKKRLTKKQKVIMRLILLFSCDYDELMI